MARNNPNTNPPMMMNGSIFEAIIVTGTTAMRTFNGA